MEKGLIKTAFILGAGLGTRLMPLTRDTPKPLLIVGDRPIITYAMEHLQGIGVQRFIINTHHCPEKYVEAFPQSRWRDIPIILRHEPVLLDTAGGIKNIEDLVESEERIIVYNGDIITSLPLEELIRRHLELQGEVSLALRSSGPLLNVNIDSSGFICDMRNILGRPGVRSCLFAGIYILERSFLRRLEEGKTESIVAPLIASIKNDPRSVGGAVIDGGIWHDAGSPEEYHRLRKGL
ncbi:MAG TPA: sugar phosphate nucleotidyltransferase [Smithellaceae bacterium]|jgi:NDP-sugar pyrophosphorylase family protein|nr:NTP transferase domain-containing protein [Syntrophaceae bacterium]HPL96379.1 sugar phosphate nucleotidyltransferase [Smithellaceae bacterium]HPV48293.1 sugar phosphate nucleotidyltransferase [Smithellaceae bacterium]